MRLSERLEARAAFEDKRVLDEAKAMGFVPDVYTGSQTGALLREAAELARRVEGAACVTVQEALFPDDYRCGKLIATTPETLIGQRVRLVPDDGQEVQS